MVKEVKHDLPNRHLKFRDVLPDLTVSPPPLFDYSIDKPWKLRDVMEVTGLSTFYAQQLKSRDPKTQAHIARLLIHEGNEKQFALDFLLHVDNICPPNSDQRQMIVDRVLATSGYDTQMFWTFAPDMLMSFKIRGYDDKQSMERVLAWGRSGSTQSSMTGRQHLIGLEAYVHDKKQISWILGEDPHDISHQFTAQEAGRIVDILETQYRYHSDVRFLRIHT